MTETPLQTAQRIAGEYGEDLDDDALGYIIWNHTGYPSFFQNNPQETFEQQLHEYFDETAKSS